MKHKVKPNQQERGIILIALIITIIVLVILAAVTIKAVYESNIVGYAINGATNYAEESKRENEILDQTASILESAIAKYDDEDKGIDFGNLTDEEKKALIGKCVDYTPVSGTFSDHVGEIYSGSDNNSEMSTDTSLKWRILFIEDNKLTLISDNVTTDQVMCLRGANGYNNGVLLLNNACKAMYSNSSLGATARSIKIEDLEEVSSFDKTSYSRRGEYNYGEEYSVSNTYYPAIFADEKTGKVDGKYGTKYGQSEQTEYITTGSLHATTLAGIQNEYTYNTQGYLDPIYLDVFGYKAGTTTEVDDCWIFASRCVDLSYGKVASFMFFIGENDEVLLHEAYYSTDDEDPPSYELRPVVEIDLSKVNIGETGTGAADNAYSIVAK